MSAHRPPSEQELEEMAARSARLSDRGWRHQPTKGLDLFALRDPSGDEVVHLYARPEAAQSLLQALEAARVEVPRLVAEVKRLRGEADDARARPAAPTPPAPAPKPARLLPVPEIDEDAPLSLAAPFRVGPREAKAAQTDPLAALAVQVAKALAGDAREIERARLIAMALAASRGDLETFWSARKLRASQKKNPGGAKDAKKK